MRNEVYILAEAMYYEHYKDKPVVFAFYPVESGKYFAHDWETDDVWRYWEKKAQAFLDTYPSKEQIDKIIIDGSAVRVGKQLAIRKAHGN